MWAVRDDLRLARPWQIDKNDLECKHSILVFINLPGVLSHIQKDWSSRRSLTEQGKNQSDEREEKPAGDIVGLNLTGVSPCLIP